MSRSPCTLTCYTCGKLVWEGGQVAEDANSITDLPFGDLTSPDGSTTSLGGGQGLLTFYAEAHCDRNDCPHISTNIEAAAQVTVESLLQRLVKLEASIGQPVKHEG